MMGSVAVETSCDLYLDLGEQPNVKVNQAAHVSVLCVHFITQLKRKERKGLRCVHLYKRLLFSGLTQKNLAQQR